MNLTKKIINAITNKRLSLDKEGFKYWYNFKLRITYLYWNRNLFDGYQIEIYDKKSDIHIKTVIY